MPRSRYVDVSAGIVAKPGPHFLIMDGGKLFLTVAVIEYDPECAQTDEQRRGVEVMRGLFDKARGGSDALPCYPVDSSGWTALNTEPPGVGTDPPGVGTEPPGVGTNSSTGTGTTGGGTGGDDGDPNG